MRRDRDRPVRAARTYLCYGERLREAGRKAEAQVQLRSALSAFELLGAEPWAERAREELHRSGAAVAGREPAVLELLTPQEFQVALATAEGATTREAAAKLFLTPQTVAFHLSSALAKLGLDSPAELQRTLLANAGASPSRKADRMPYMRTV